MQSPRDPKATLVRTELEPALFAFRCPSSGGLWIDGEAYWNWVRAQPGFPKPIESDAGEPVEAAEDSGQPLLSPRSGRLMRKFAVGYELEFRIDFDRASSGFWLDAGEYETLRARNLHDELHLICSPEYQKKLASLAASRASDRRLVELIGAETCAKIDAFSDAVRGHPKRSLVLAYLRERLEDQD